MNEYREHCPSEYSRVSSQLFEKLQSVFIQNPFAVTSNPDSNLESTRSTLAVAFGLIDRRFARANTSVMLINTFARVGQSAEYRPVFMLSVENMFGAHEWAVTPDAVFEVLDEDDGLHVIDSLNTTFVDPPDIQFLNEIVEYTDFSGPHSNAAISDAETIYQ